MCIDPRLKSLLVSLSNVSQCPRPPPHPLQVVLQPYHRYSIPSSQTNKPCPPLRVHHVAQVAHPSRKSFSKQKDYRVQKISRSSNPKLIRQNATLNEHIDLEALDAQISRIDHYTPPVTKPKTKTSATFTFSEDSASDTQDSDSEDSDSDSDFEGDSEEEDE
jgi:hypothetical protein